MKRAFALYICITSALHLALPIAGSEDDSGDKPFALCPDVDSFHKFEFQVQMNVTAFGGLSSPLIVAERASLVLRSFVSLSNGDIVPTESPDEEVFTEKGWYLGQADAAQTHIGCASALQNSSLSYVRTRVKQDVKDGELKKKEKYSSSVKIRGIDPATFEEPSSDVDGDLECDVHVDRRQSTYKVKIKKLEEAISFETFADVLELFPWVSDFFRLSPDAVLLERDFFVVHHFEWDDVQFHDVTMQCDLDLRFHEFEAARIGSNPFKVEFSCNVKSDDIAEASADLADTLDALQSTFVEFQRFVDRESYLLAT